MATPVIYGPSGQVISGNGGYGNAGASRTKKALKAFNPVSSNAVMDIDMHNQTLRQRSRTLYMASPVATSAIRTNRTNVIGCGLRLKPRIDKEILELTAEQAMETERRIKAEFNLWATNKNHCDATAVNDFNDMQQLTFISWLMSGDCMTLLKYVSTDKMRPYSLRLHIIEADRISTPPPGRGKRHVIGAVDGVPLHYLCNTTQGQAANGNQIHDGVEVDESGKIVAYHICNEHLVAAQGIGGEAEWIRVEAFGESTGDPNILHVMDTERPEQYRGVPYLAQVIEPLLQLRRYTESELSAAVVQSFFTAFIKTEAPTDAMPMNETGETKYNDPNEYEMGPGTINVLNPNESVDFGTPSRPSTGFDGFVTAITQQIGAALEVPQDLLMKAFNSSYSASRAALLEAWKAFKMRREWFVSDFCQPVYEAWFSEAVALGRIEAPGYFDDPLVRAAWLGSEWIGPSQGQLDPVREVNAEMMACEAGFSTREQSTIRLNGGQYDANAEQLARENAMLAEGMPGTETGDESGEEIAGDTVNTRVAAWLRGVVSGLKKEGGKDAGTSKTE